MFLKPFWKLSETFCVVQGRQKEFYLQKFNTRTENNVSIQNIPKNVLLKEAKLLNLKDKAIMFNQKLVKNDDMGEKRPKEGEINRIQGIDGCNKISNKKKLVTRKNLVTKKLKKNNQKKRMISVNIIRI